MDNRDIARRTELTGHQVRPLRGSRPGRAGMSGVRGRRERSQRDRAHHRHLIELASLLATAGLADMFADTFGASSHGASVLIGLGIALVAGTVVHHLWIGRAVHAPPGSAPRAAAAAVAGSGAAEAAEAAEAGAAGTAAR